jgi:hypothetical protein
LLGCVDLCNRGAEDTPTAFRDGVTSPSGGEYATSATNDPFLDFPSGKRYRLFHGLSDAPTLIVPYVSFSPRPLADGSGFTVSPGNQTVIRAVTPSYIEVENDTCTDFFLRVVATRDTPTIIPDAGDGG